MKDYHAPYDFNTRNYTTSINMNRLKLIKDSVVLDYGSGSGQFAAAFINRGFTVFAADISGEAEERLKKRVDEENQERIKFSIIEENVNRLPYQSNFFDVVVCREVLEHVENYGLLISEFSRITKREGIVVISVPSQRGEKIFHFLDRRWLIKSDHTNIFKKKELRELVKRHSFVILGIEGKLFYWFFNWFFLSLFKTEHDMGRIKNRKTLFKILVRFWQVLAVFKVKTIFEILGDRVFPKSYFFYLKNKK